jgi:hypothetical protein
MSTINLSLHPVRSIADVKTVAFLLGRELRIAELPTNHSRLLEVVAKLCGVHHFNELQRRFGASASVTELGIKPAEPSAESDVESVSQARIIELEGQLNTARGVASTLYHALDDASSVVDAGDDEDYAYQAELESGASFLGIRRS